MSSSIIANKKRDRHDAGGSRATSSGDGLPVFSELTQQCPAIDRDVIHSEYAAILNRIKGSDDDISNPGTNNFMAMMDQVESLHQHVKKPRQQVVDAEALLGLAGTLEASVRSQITGGFTPADLISCLLGEFGRVGSTGSDGIAKKHILWKDIGLQVSPIFGNCGGCCTMMGPMENELKQRAPNKRRTRTPKTTLPSAQPKELQSATEEKTDTDKNMIAMYEILRQKKTVKLENLLLNRKSFAQTVENLFALSFLVKDGRVVIAVDEKGSHLVSPRNAPSSRVVMSKEVVYTHFIFRLDFSDWKLMKDSVPEGEELMPVRNGLINLSARSQAEAVPKNIQDELVPNNFQTAIPVMPIKIHSRNRGALVQEGQHVGEESLETADCRRKFQSD